MKDQVAIAQEQPQGQPRLSRFQVFSSLQYRDYRLLWTSNLFATAGNWIQQVTLGWLMYEMTGSAFMVGALLGARALPFLLAAPIGGVLSDRFDRRKLLLTNQVFLGLLAFGFAVLVISGRAQAWHLLAFAALSGAGWSANNPVRQALVADIVPRQDLMNAIALNSVAFNFNRMAGPAAGGLLIAFFGPGTNFLIQAACYTGVALVVLPMRVQPRDLAATRRASPWSNFGEGIRYVARDQATLVLILMATIPFLFVMPFLSGLMPVFAKDVFRTGPEGLGLLLSMVGVGGLLGALAVAALTQVRSLWLLQVGAGILSGLAMIALSRTTSMALALAPLVVVGAAEMCFSAINNNALQAITPDALRGRVMSIYMMGHGVAPVGSLLAGILADFYDSPLAVLIAGSLTTGLVLIMGLRFKPLRPV